jgi:YD repeat-containing protein
MRSGTFVYQNTDLTIGEKISELSLVRTFSRDAVDAQPLGQFFKHNWDIKLIEERVPVPEADTIPEYDYQMTIAYGNLGTAFRKNYASSGMFRQVSANGYGTLTWTGAISGAATYTFTAKDGTKVQFRALRSLVSGSDCSSVWRCAYASKITTPDGTTFTLDYDMTGPNGTGSAMLRTVTSNRGYALLFEYAGAQDFRITRVCALNLATTALPVNLLCPAGAPTANYGYSGANLTSASNAASGVEQITYEPQKFSIWRPGDITPFLTNTWASSEANDLYVTAQEFGDQTSASYTWNFVNQGGSLAIAGGTYTDEMHHSVQYLFGNYPIPNSNETTRMITPGPELVRDPLQHDVTFSYCVPHPVTNECLVSVLQSQTSPEGNKIAYVYDNYRNLTQVTVTPKPGSGLVPTVQSALYPCSNAVTCAKPSSITDANGKTTNITYSDDHGGTLTEMGPPPAPGGARPLKVRTYAQRYANVKGSNGALVAAATPIWVLSTETQCQTTADNPNSPVCDDTAPAPKAVTSYEYGAAGGAESLLVKGVAVTADGQTLRTCYSYDNWGRKISETSANASLASCS